MPDLKPNYLGLPCIMNWPHYTYRQKTKC